ncbi:hypothetical protein QTP88_009384 [Uroleucon formosanum]
MSRVRKKNNNKGSGLINSVINHLPVELHLPGYNFAGPGTKLKERLARGERGINNLDELARAHDIAYEESALTGGVGNIVKVVNELNSGKNAPIHLGKGLYLSPHKGSSYKIVKDKLPLGPKNRGSAVINLDIENGTGTHWVTYKKIGKQVKYYDSFGNLTPPLELQKYFNGWNNNQPVEITDEIRFINNGLAFLFSGMKYKINGTQIQKLVNPGISTTLKGYYSYNETNISSHHNAAWGSDIKNANKDFIDDNHFNGCINLKDFFGFCEDYKRILINCNQQLILNRVSIDMNAVKQFKNNEAATDAPKLKYVKINITKILSWELCEYPFLPQNTSHSWKVKTSNKLEKPRYVILGFQTARKNSAIKAMSYFDHCKIKNVKVYLNSEVFPYEDFQSDFTKNKMATLYRAYAEFQKSYYGYNEVTPLLNRSDFKNISPIIVVDMSRQNDNVKMSTVDLRIELEADEAFSISTSAYCLILHVTMAMVLTVCV